MTNSRQVLPIPTRPAGAYPISEKKKQVEIAFARESPARVEDGEPPKAWIELLRDIDPPGIREPDFLPGDARLDRLEAIVRAEMGA
ncbi:MAG: hypothetical protein HYY17_03710 [Planctomycetes bacterium]|nr:hypothetical protein [Planctomycetota bacterium]